MNRISTAISPHQSLLRNTRNFSRTQKYSQKTQKTQKHAQPSIFSPANRSISMQNYRKRARVKNFPEFIPNCIQVQHGGRVKNYVQAAQQLLSAESVSKITIIGHGVGINKAVSVGEILKRQNSLESAIEMFQEDETDEWEPLDSQLDKIVVTKHVPCIKIILAKH
jgi:DNA-binding protein